LSVEIHEYEEVLKESKLIFEIYNALWDKQYPAEDYISEVVFNSYELQYTANQRLRDALESYLGHFDAAAAKE
jgi:hypothetical protein